MDKITDDLLLAAGALRDANDILKAQGRFHEAAMVREALENVQRVSQVVTNG